jgi:integrase
MGRVVLQDSGRVQQVALRPVLLWKFAVSRKLVSACEPEKIEQRSTSKKLAMNQKVRQPLDVAGFNAIDEKSPAWLQIAMEQSLVTLQARTEICNMRHTDYRDGHLFVIRDKVSGDSDMAFIKIALTEQLEDIRRRSLKVDDIVSPYLVHRAPDRRRQWTEGKPHWTFVNPEYLSKAFAEARDACGLYANLKPEQRPTFHEIRGLDSRLYKAQGMSEAAIQVLMTHANPRTTAIYLDGGAPALADGDYVPVSAPLSVREILGTKGTN